MRDGRSRVVIENVRPQIDCGRFAAKRALGETVTVEADVFADGHDVLSVRLEYRAAGQESWTFLPMKHQGNDVWAATFKVEDMAGYGFTVSAWVDHYKSWLRGLEKKSEAGMDVEVELQDGKILLEAAATRAQGKDRDVVESFARKLTGSETPEAAVAAANAPALLDIMARYPEQELLTRYEKELAVDAEPARAAFSTWYELFPRSAGTGPDKAHGTFADVEDLLPEIADMGFDVLYLPPIHPIGATFRKGRNNRPTSGPGDSGSPWAIGSPQGGHKAVHPDLGTLKDFERLVAKARELGIEVALDVAFQCSPDHPYVSEHPRWFKHRADGSVQYAENPPKIYQDIYPFDFECKDWKALWEELKSVFLFWIKRGVRIFRVDNPHTKPMAFWEWVIAEIRRDYPEVILLGEAFTRPKLMYRLAKAGFTQSYTYFTWRNTKTEIETYVDHLVNTAPRDFFRPNFWPNTPDILPEYLQFGGRPAFIVRLVLAATLSSNYGIYGPAFELGVSEAVPGGEEYLNSEKYEVKAWNRDRPGHLKSFIKRINAIRRENPALQNTWNIRFLKAESDFVLFFARWARDDDDILLVAVNLDPYNKQSAWLELPLQDFGIEPEQSFLVHDLIGDDKFVWQGPRNFIELDPQVIPARIFRLKKRLKRETDFDYFF
ncbi:MAG: alpha-1,4-glucan--maltose-1-phosphate maltosyltransferase [Thermodesulfobacteriota bacterium]|nr:alpha-1,4-glucan--maltose-1-phosphate maltosyltransferase [Thermodesulfobacteriota bacterium]